jgi:transcriptional regulator with XRE-family HTH domain
MDKMASGLTAPDMTADIQVKLDYKTPAMQVMNIGQKIRRRRRELDLSLEKLGAMVGVSRSAVHQWETKDDAGITLANRIALSEAIELPLSDLLPPNARGLDLMLRESREILLVERFRALPQPQKEVCLRLVVVMSEGHTQDS